MDFESIDKMGIKEIEEIYENEIIINTNNNSIISYAGGNCYCRTNSGTVYKPWHAGGVTYSFSDCSGYEAPKHCRYCCSRFGFSVISFSCTGYNTTQSSDYCG